MNNSDLDVCVAIDTGSVVALRSTQGGKECSLES
jgi:hypothetical protein